MAYDRGSVAGKPFLMKHAEDAKIKDEGEKVHFEAAFKGVDHTTPSIEANAPSMIHESVQALQSHAQSNKGSLGTTRLFLDDIYIYFFSSGFFLMIYIYIYLYSVLSLDHESP